MSCRNFVYTLQVLVLEAIIKRQSLRRFMGGHFLKEIPEQGTGWVPFVYLPEVALVLVREPLVVGVVQLCTAEGAKLRRQNEQGGCRSEDVRLDPVVGGGI